MPWRQDQCGRGKLLQYAAEGFQQQFLFTFGRTPANDDVTILPAGSPYRFHQTRSRGASNIELQVSANPHLFRRRAKRAQSARIIFGLGEKEIDLAQDSAEEPAEPAVAGKGAVRDASVHDGD